MGTRSAVVLLALATVMLTGCSTTKVVTTATTADTIAVTGFGTALSKPDRATARFAVTRSDVDPRKAMSAASDASNKLLAALKKAGVADNDLQTGSVRLDPQYAYPGGRPKLTGYAASLDVSAKTRNIDKVGDVIVAATQAGATNVSGVVFDLDDTNPARYEASANAVNDARSRAQAMAKAAGRTLGGVVSIGEPQRTGAMPYDGFGNYVGALRHAGPAGPEIQPGELTAGESVLVTFALK